MEGGGERVREKEREGEKQGERPKKVKGPLHSTTSRTSLTAQAKGI